ncbi:formimidoylglutamase [Corynebacterium sp. H128]|uniref:formimidoylglutamase n=1 Tax=unclassified Corynebacterium TaxID=2624378 RepID=UPI0030A32F47
MTVNIAAWQGRVDGPGKEHARWNSRIQPFSFESEPGVALIGFASDEGVRRNKGRVGSAQAPDQIRGTLAGLAVHHDLPLFDAGTVAVDDGDLEKGHEELAGQVASLIGQGHTAIVLGGGHETAYGSHCGLRSAVPGSMGIINLDAHFDLRTADLPTSGTPFKQIADRFSHDFHYSVFGISKPNNTVALFQEADRLGVTVALDEELLALPLQECAKLVTRSAAEVDHVHLSIDLDVLPAGVMPGVSAPAGLGVDLPRIRAMAIAAAQTGKLRLVDVVELNPKFDVDGRSAKLAARLIDDIVSTLAS